MLTACYQLGKTQTAKRKIRIPWDWFAYLQTWKVIAAMDNNNNDILYIQDLQDILYQNMVFYKVVGLFDWVTMWLIQIN